ncbi:DUF1652 domain-containing protein [Pseudomonas fulva]|uniref:DUF1652 domain-containing protein n=1 Tax=Pseudomonas fulva TaxID=47880 RepID=UPI00201D902A|nr:DUF1652 domain-containing protein [Pseudomonas fulva]UQY33489.1 DUF1652 domain-containing protein [Pseudomonas fulva]
MAKMPLKVAVLHIRQYFQPLVVNITPLTSRTMDVTLLDPKTGESVTLQAIPCRRMISPAELFQLINLIESQAEARMPSVFSSHFVNKLHQL